MEQEPYISIERLCSLHEIELTFFTHLHEMGRIKYVTVEKTPCIHRDTLTEVERMIRLHRDLEVNPQGIDVIMNLLERLEQLQHELNTTRNRLYFFDKDRY
jgi:chaperone modulatory protein CbpM